MEKKEKSRLELLERKSLYLNGVHNVDLFDEEKIILQTDLGRLVIKGKSMNITNLDVEHGNIQIDGRINCLEYLPERRLWPMKKK
ncbi:MAG: sporulation protein YabP [Peptococcaceae bacterium]|nr:sporulation protein YabP [Peptococcaceae bacterium]